MKVKFTTNIDECLLKNIKVKAIEEGRNVNEIIEEQLEKYLEEEHSMKKIVIECLEILSEEQLLNSIGEKLAEEPDRFPETICITAKPCQLWQVELGTVEKPIPCHLVSSLVNKK